MTLVKRGFMTRDKTKTARCYEMLSGIRCFSARLG